MKQLSTIQRTRIINWEIPYLIIILEKKYQISALQIVDSPSFSDYENNWFSFDHNTGFPLFVGNVFLGVLICFQSLDSLKAQKIKTFMDNYLQEVFYKISLEENYHSSKKEKKVSTTTNKPTYPLLLEQEKREDLLRLAYDMYLKSACFAFLNTEDLTWEKGIFSQMQGVFVCVPSFQQLSLFQKEILIQDLLKQEISCSLVLGIQKKEMLPSDWRNLFYSHYVS